MSTSARRATNNFLDFALFVTFFPHLVAGPIRTPTILIRSSNTSPRHERSADLGLALMTLDCSRRSCWRTAFSHP